MSKNLRLLAWFSEAPNLRKFAMVNVWVWLLQHPIITVWFLKWREQWGDVGPPVFYLAHLSIAALWLSSLAWWQSTRVEEHQVEAESH